MMENNVGLPLGLKTPRAKIENGKRPIRMRIMTNRPRDVVPRCFWNGSKWTISMGHEMREKKDVRRLRNLQIEGQVLFHDDE
ncbi:hypothetical protein [Dyadobacter sp. 32]|uniref:hypothetical protein n=1 Tax=Dyadobacter sp. 32 TaxID=538966 RepID=UPI0011EC0CA8